MLVTKQFPVVIDFYSRGGEGGGDTIENNSYWQLFLCSAEREKKTHTGLEQHDGE